MQQLGQYHMYSMQFEGILNSTTRILSRLDDNVNSSRDIFQLNGDEKSRFPVRCDISIHCPAFASIPSSLWVFGRTDIHCTCTF